MTNQESPVSNVWSAPQIRYFVYSAIVAVFACEGVSQFLMNFWSMTEGKHIVYFAVSLIVSVYFSLQAGIAFIGKILAVIVATPINFIVSWKTGDVIVQRTLENAKMAIDRIFS